MSRNVENQTALLHYLRFLQRAGFLYLEPPKDAPKMPSRKRHNALEHLKTQVAQCTKCPLAEGRTHVVFGEGNPDAEILFIGEAPGKDEDVQGRPFVGRSGKLLDQMMAEVGLARQDVFIGNVIKCRPPDNRDPKDEEMDTCEPWLKEQLQLLEPKVIITLGRFAAQRLLGEKISIMKSRGRFFLYEGIKLMPMLHPAAVLRNMNLLQDSVGDLRKAVEEVRRQQEG